MGDAPAGSDGDAAVLSPDEFDELIREIRVGALAAMLLFALTVPAAPHLSSLAPWQRAVVIAQLIGYALSAFAIGACSRPGATLLFATCVGSVCLVASPVRWTSAPGVLLIVVAVRTLRRTRRLHRLVAFARARRAAASGAAEPARP